MWKGSDIGKAKVAAAGAAAGRPAPRNAARRAAASAVAICAILAAGLALWLWPRGGGSAVRQGSGTGGVRRPETHPVATPPPAPAPKAAEAAKSAASPAPHAQESKTPEEIEAEERARDPLYDRHHIVAARPLLESPLEQVIHSVFSVEPGDMPPMLPPLPPVGRERLDEALRSITETGSGDGEEAREAKAVVNLAKAELRRFLDEGGTAEAFLQHYVNVLDSAFRERNMCRELQLRSMRNDPPEVAREFYATVQRQLREKGIRPLTLSRRQREHLGIEEE